MLTAEALVTREPEFRPLFSTTEVLAARRRLSEYGFPE